MFLHPAPLVRPIIHQNRHIDPIVGWIAVQPILRPGVPLISQRMQPILNPAHSKIEKLTKMAVLSIKRRKIKNPSKTENETHFFREVRSRNVY